MMMKKCDDSYETKQYFGKEYPFWKCNECEKSGDKKHPGIAGHHLDSYFCWQCAVKAERRDRFQMLLANIANLISPKYFFVCFLINLYIYKLFFP